MSTIASDESQAGSDVTHGEHPAPLNVAQRGISEGQTRWLVAGVFASLVGMVLLVLSVARREITVTDQALYLLMIEDPEISRRSASGFHFLLNPLFDLVGQSVVEWRLLRAVLDIGADLFLGWALVEYIRTRHPATKLQDKWTGFAMVGAIGLIGFASWSWPANGFGYNELGTILVTTIGALLLLILKNGPRTTRASLFLASILGALLVAFAITRWTGATIMLFGLTVITLTHFAGRDIARLVGSTFAGAVAAAVIIHFGVADLRTIADGIVSGTVDVSRGSHSLSFLLDRYTTSLLNGLTLGGATLILIVLGVLVLHLWRSGSASLPVVCLTVGLASIWAVAGDRLVLDNRLWSINGASVVLAVVAVVLLAAHGIGSTQQYGLHLGVKSILVPGMLLAIPVAAQLGTDVFIFVSMILLAPLWVAAIVLLLSSSEVLTSAVRSFGFVGGIVLGAACVMLSAEGLLRVHSFSPLDQAVELEEGRFAGLAVGEAKFELFTDLEELRTDLRPNPTVISLWNRPAVTYALGGHGIGFPWYSPNGIEAGVATVEAACRDDGFTPAPDIVFVMEETESEQFQRMVAALATCGIHFPADFERASPVRLPPNMFTPNARQDGLLEVFISSS